MDTPEKDDFAGGIFLDPKGDGGLIVLFDLERNRTWKKKITAFYSKTDGSRVLRDLETKGSVPVKVRMKWEGTLLASALPDDASTRGTSVLSGYMASVLVAGFLPVKSGIKKTLVALQKLHPVYVEIAMPYPGSVPTSPEGMILLGAGPEFLAILVYGKDIARITLNKFQLLMRPEELQLFVNEVEKSALPEKDPRDFSIIEGWPAKVFAAVLLALSTPDEEVPDEDEGPGELDEPPPPPDFDEPPTQH